MPATKRAEAWRDVHRAADEFAPRFTGPFLTSVGRLRRRVTLPMLEESVTRGTMSADLADAIDGVQIAKAADPSDLAGGVYRELLATTATIAGRQVGLGMRFDVTNPFVLRAARDLTGELIREVSSETKQAVRRIIFNSVRDGVPPREAAKLIRQIVGLTTRQALAVDNLRKGVFEATDDILRAERQAGLYGERLLRDRAENIARTETMRAANRGQQLAWTAARDEGLLPEGFEQRWLVTPDDRLCPRCAPMQGQTVQLGFLFRETETGVLPSRRVPAARPANVLSPPLHPRCRCVLQAVVEDV